MRFVADESCDFAVVKGLRRAGHDVIAITELKPGAEDDVVLSLALSEARVLLTEDKDFGTLVYARGQQTAGVVLVRFPVAARSRLGDAVVTTVDEIGDRLLGAFVVLEPGRVRISKIPKD